MPLTIPAFSQYQSPIVPLRGLWNAAPPEGDKFVSCEIDWLVTTGNVNCQQFSFSGNSPVAISQIAAMSVDNSRSGADVQFIFADSGTQLAVPAGETILAPVFTNGLMLYANSPNAIAGDITIFCVHNSIPPPIPISPIRTQNHDGTLGQNIADGTTPIVPAGVNGTLNTISIAVSGAGGAAAQGGLIQLLDGTGKQLWATYINVPADGVFNQTFNVPGLNVRFTNGINLVISISTLTGSIVANVYYTTP